LPAMSPRQPSPSPPSNTGTSFYRRTSLVGCNSPVCPGHFLHLLCVFFYWMHCVRKKRGYSILFNKYIYYRKSYSKYSKKIQKKQKLN